MNSFLFIKKEEGKFMIKKDCVEIEIGLGDDVEYLSLEVQEANDKTISFIKDDFYAIFEKISNSLMKMEIYSISVQQNFEKLIKDLSQNKMTFINFKNEEEIIKINEIKIIKKDDNVVAIIFKDDSFKSFPSDKNTQNYQIISGIINV